MGFNPQADIDLIHQDLDPGTSLVNRLRRPGGVRLHVVELAQQVIKVGQVNLLLTGRAGTPSLADVLDFSRIWASVIDTSWPSP